MKKFQFPLESVLKVRTLHKRMAERDVAATRARLERVREEIERTREAYRQSFHIDAAREANPAFTVAVVTRYREGLMAREQQLLEQHRQLTDTLSGQTKALTRRMKDEMVIAKLEEHQRLEHQRQAEHAEQAEIEEIDLLKRGNQA